MRGVVSSKVMWAGRATVWNRAAVVTLGIILPVLVVLVASPAGAVTGTWSSAGSMSTFRANHTATLLDNGKVLVAGGGPSDASADLYHPGTNTWSLAGSMAVHHSQHTATLLANGKVLVTGGAGNVNQTLATAQLYNPATNAWSSAGSMSSVRRVHTATLLSNGKVLVVGGNNGDAAFGVHASAELYDPATNTWSPAASMALPRWGHTATRLADGRVLVTGGGSGQFLQGLGHTAELYDPATDTWSAAASMADRRIGHTATLLSTGKMLVAGGAPGGTSIASTELYDPANNTWSSAGSMTTARSGHKATRLASGEVLVAGGANASGAPTATAELYDPATNMWSPTASMSVPRSQHAAALLPSGDVLVAGGGMSSAELYGPAVVDTTVPLITPNVSGTEGQNGWYTSDVTVSWTVTDGESPITSQSGCATTTITQDTAGTTLTCTATSAGGTSSKSVTIKRDTTAPTLNLPADITKEATDPNGATVNFQATASDEDPANPQVSCTPPSGSTSPIGTTKVNCSAKDTAGNEATGSFNVTVQDTTPPTISGVPSDITKIATSASGAQVSYTAPTATDLVDSVVGVSCTPASGSTFAIGETTVSCTASDSRTNTATKTFKVSVLYDFAGFVRPVDNLPTINVAKAGSAIPVKFSLGGDYGLEIFAEGYPRSQQIACDSTAPVDGIEETVTASASGLSYDASLEEYDYIWKSAKAWEGSCRQLVVKFKDGTFQRANFKFRR
jgi:hypothetical protein